MWALVPFHVGTDYGMWALITVKPQMLPTSQRNGCPHQTESGAHIDRNTHMLANVVLKTWRDVVSGGNGSRAFRELTTTQGSSRMKLAHYDTANLRAVADKRAAAKNRMELH
jgi:hypothetical protein